MIMRSMGSFSWRGRAFGLEIEDIVWALGVSAGSLVVTGIAAIYMLLFA